MSQLACMVHIWQLQPSRSLKLSARRELGEMRVMGGRECASERLRRVSAAAEPRQVLAFAALLHIPMAGYLDRSPAAWLTDAWQVSGVLVGLVVALIIFLLQSAAGQSLRSEVTFLAMLRSSGVLWPVAWALVFIGAVAIVERFAAASPSAGSAVETYTLLLFLVQVGLFGVAFFRTIRVVSPQGVARQLASQFRDSLAVADRTPILGPPQLRAMDCSVGQGSFLTVEASPEGEPEPAGSCDQLTITPSCSARQRSANTAGASIPSAECGW
ncbi:MAG: hypothetical protein EDQ89_13105 [Acidobacteria bacterium]|nr:MAG: hypothetical protein EDQ89_13105 [Acidobacteriota bacterium]